MPKINHKFGKILILVGPFDGTLLPGGGRADIPYQPSGPSAK